MSIQVYKTRTCAKCVEVVRFLKYKGHKVEEIFIDDDPKLQQFVYEKSNGFLMVPFTVIKKGDTEKYISGANMPAIASAVSVI